MGYLDEGRYDYISGGRVVFDNKSSATLTGTGTSLSWQHTAAGTDRLVLVAISWLEATGEDTLQGVTYDGTAMTHLATVGNLDVFYRVNPPTGTKNIVATWVGTHAKGAVGGAVSCQGVDPDDPLGAAATASGSSTSPLVTLYATLHSGLVFDAVGVLAQASTTSLNPTAASLLTERWDLSAGTLPTLTLVQGAGATRGGGGASDSPSDLELGWTLGASRPWNTLAVEARPRAVKLVIDAEGSAFSHSPFGVNALDYQSLQDAVDSLPDDGGTVLVPSGRYVLPSSLTIDKENVTLQGAGRGNTIIEPDTSNHHDLIIVNKAGLRLVNLTLDGKATSRVQDGKSCMVMNGKGVSGNLVQQCYFESVEFKNAPRYGLFMRDVILFLAVNCQFVGNKLHGARMETVTEGSTTLRFIDCVFSGNSGIGAELEGIGGGTFFGCNLEGNESSGITNQGNGIDALSCSKLEVLSSNFERPEGPTGEFIRLGSCSTSVVDSCTFNGGTDEDNQPAQAVNFLNCYFSRFSNNVADNTTDYIVRFDSNCQDCLEFCNRMSDPTGGPPPIEIESLASVIGMSRRSLGLRGLPGDADLPTTPNVALGSLAWVNDPDEGSSNLRVWDGEWKHIFLTAHGRRVVDLYEQDDDVNQVLFESPGAGMYRVAFYARCDTAGSAGLARVRVRWNDGSARVVEEVMSLQAVGTFVYREVQVFSADEEDLTYEVVREDVLGTPKYSLHVRGEAIQ